MVVPGDNKYPLDCERIDGSEMTEPDEGDMETVPEFKLQLEQPPLTAGAAYAVVGTEQPQEGCAQPHAGWVYVTGTT